MRSFFKWISIVLIAILVIITIFVLPDILQQAKDNTYMTSLSAISTAIAAIGAVLLLLVTYLTLLEMKEQRRLMEEPAVTIRLLPDEKNINLFNIVLKNSGGGPAYDINVTFTPDLPYRDETTLNKLNMFKRLPLLDRNEEIIIFFDSAIEYYASENPKQVEAKLTYYIYPDVSRKKYRKEKSFIIDFEERAGQLSLARKDMTDLVKEIEELKHALLISTIERNEGRDK